MIDFLMQFSVVEWCWMFGTLSLVCFLFSFAWSMIWPAKMPVTLSPAVKDCPFCEWETIREISIVKGEMRAMTDAMKNLTEQVKKNVDLESSVAMLVKGLADQIAASKDDPAQILVLTDQLKGSLDTLIAAVVASTPAAPVS